nr:C40 family peptidase [Pedococcus badiiscoriae]
MSDIVASAAQPAVKTSAVIAASGGLVASFALPASAASASQPSTPTTAATTAPVAVQAPETAGPAATNAFGVIGFKATAQPKPKPAPKPAPAPTVVRDTGVSRSATRPVFTSLKPATGGILGIAAQYKGIMYSYGGTSPSTGFDCSGYTQYVFGRMGISLPRTAEEQRAAATPVSNPQPGDLVFFGSPAFHVGIYAGNGMMWDSPRSGKAVDLRPIWSSNVSYGRP